MRIFGVEISRPVAAAEAQPVRSFEIGDSGTHILNGLISEEYNRKHPAKAAVMSGQAAAA